MVVDPIQKLFDDALAAHKVGKLEEALTGYNALLNRSPYDPMLRFLIGNAMMQKGQNGLAITIFETVLREDEDQAHVWNDLGCALKAEHFDEAAMLAWEKALEKGGRTPATLNNLATLYADSGYPDKALPYIEEALTLDPENPHVHWNRALALLTKGVWEEGWREHEYRAAVQNRNVAVRQYGEPWRGETDGVLVIHGEQGLGDEIMFSTCVPEVLCQRANVVLECERRLVPIMSYSFGLPAFPDEAAVKASGLLDGKKVYQIGLGSLPKLYRNKDADFPSTSQVLIPKPELVEEAQRMLSGLPRPLIGVSWMGGTKHTRVQHRSLSGKIMHDLVSPFGTAISLQYGQLADVEADAAGLLRFGDWTDGTDIEKLAAMIECMNEVVSVCTTLIHLAGAMGKPAMVLTPLRSSWRYGQKSGKGAMLWYPEHTLYRQYEDGNWDPVFEAVRTDLRAKYAHQ